MDPSTVKKILEDSETSMISFPPSSILIWEEVAKAKEEPRLILEDQEEQEELEVKAEALILAISEDLEEEEVVEVKDLILEDNNNNKAASNNNNKNRRVPLQILKLLKSI